MTPYSEPKVSFLVLDYNKPIESQTLLLSLKKNVKFPYKVIYMHNGMSNYAQKFLTDGLVDHLICTRQNNGLGVGTRDLFAACFSEYAIYVQNDQFLAREFTENELNSIISKIGTEETDDKTVHSIGLAGDPCGINIYSERAHLIKTISYRGLESDIGMEMDYFGFTDWLGTNGLPNGGAGPYHEFQWREGWMQKFYSANGFIQLTYDKPLFADNGIYATRQNPDGSIWIHRTDNKKLWNIVPPKEKHMVYPKFTNDEWDVALKEGWKDGQIPYIENNKKDSFTCWGQTEEEDADYINFIRKILTRL